MTEKGGVLYNGCVGEKVAGILGMCDRERGVLYNGCVGEKVAGMLGREEKVTSIILRTARFLCVIDTEICVHVTPGCV